MKTNYEGILERILLIASKAHTIRNTSKVENVKKELMIYKKLVEIALIEKKKVIEKNPEIKEIEDKINILVKFKKLELTKNDFKEGLGINKHIYRLSNTTSIDTFNESFLTIMMLLKTINVNFLEEDFNITTSVNKYIKAFYKYFNTDKYTKEMRNVFDGLYWENNDLKDEIVLNLRNNLNKVEGVIQADMLKTLLGFQRKYNINNENIDTEIASLLKKEKALKESDRFTIKSKIENKTINVKNFIGENKIIDQAIASFINTNDYMNMDLASRNAFEDNVSNILQYVSEYDAFSKFAFLIDEVNEYLKTDIDNNILKNYDKLYNKLVAKKEILDTRVKKLNIEKEKLLNKNCKTLNSEEKRLDNLTKMNRDIKAVKADIKGVIKEKVDLQKKYNETMFIKKVKETINSNSTLFDCLLLFSANHIQLLNAIKKHTNLKMKEKEGLVLELKRLVGGSNISLTKMIHITDVDRYKQTILGYAVKCNINLNLDDMNNTKRYASMINQFKNLKRSKLNMEDIESALN